MIYNVAQGAIHREASGEPTETFFCRNDSAWPCLGSPAKAECEGIAPFGAAPWGASVLMSASVVSVLACASRLAFHTSQPCSHRFGAGPRTHGAAIGNLNSRQFGKKVAEFDRVRQMS